MQFDNVNDFITWVEAQKKFSPKTTLVKMEYLAGLFNHPERKFKTIHITGTNGKGSLVAYLRTIYEEKGLKVASYTSPYVECFNERIYYNHHFIADTDLLEIANLILSKYDKIIQDGYELPSFFEFITLVAFIYFAKQEDLDIAIIEVGLGGRLDATNIIKPLCSVITNVGYDHMQQLGNTLEDITNEKLGIVKTNIPLVTSSNNHLLLDQMAKYCQNKHSNFQKVDFEHLKIKQATLDGSIFSYQDLDDIKINLIGTYQVTNAALAIEVIKTCNNLSTIKKSKLEISNEILYEGLKKTTWIGRFEKVSDEPLIYLDGGHNIECIKEVTSFIKTLNIKNKRAIISISADKEVDKMIELLDDTFDEVVFTKYTYYRSADAKNLYNMSKNHNKKIINDIKDTINYCYDKRTKFTIFIGSLYFVSEVRPLFKKN